MDERLTLISEVIGPEMVDLNARHISDKDALFRHMIPLLQRGGAVDSQDKFLEAIYERESLGPTYMGDFIAIPHGKSPTVRKTGIAFCRCNDGFFYETAGDGGEVKLAFMLAVPEKISGDEYMGILARLARLLVYPEFVDALFKASEYAAVIAAIQQCEVLLD
jgi:mannitol/fructose-specific phosphotransferase system IIA component (Ntr-type)